MTLAILPLCLVIGQAMPPHDRPIELEPVPRGAMMRIGSYAQWSVTLLDARPAEIRKVPADLVAPTYGVFEFGSLDLRDRRVHLVLDEPEDADARLLVDANRNGDLTDDPAPEWNPVTRTDRDGRPFVQYSGGAFLSTGHPDTDPVHVAFRCLSRAARETYERAPNLNRWRDYAWAGRIDFGTGPLDVLLEDGAVTGDFRSGQGEAGRGIELLVDVNRNGVFDVRGESFVTTEPFNIGGTTWEVADLAPSGRSFRLEVSERHVPEIPPPPNQTAGQKALAFEATTLDGKKLRFPDDYEGRVVLLEFWATWCGPCIAEMPNLVKTYETYHDRGFDILSISIDEADQKATLEADVRRHGMTWTHVHDAGHWDGRLVQLYCPGGVPAGYLVDGTTGIIQAAIREVRGEKLAGAVEKALAGRR